MNRLYDEEKEVDEAIESQAKTMVTKRKGSRPKMLVNFDHMYDHTMAIIITLMSFNNQSHLNLIVIKTPKIDVEEINRLYDEEQEADEVI